MDTILSAVLAPFLMLTFPLHVTVAGGSESPAIGIGLLVAFGLGLWRATPAGRHRIWPWLALALGIFFAAGLVYGVCHHQACAHVDWPSYVFLALLVAQLPAWALMLWHAAGARFAALAASAYLLHASLFLLFFGSITVSGGSAL